jgi:hypothetical protein
MSRKKATPKTKNYLQQSFHILTPTLATRQSTQRHLGKWPTCNISVLESFIVMLCINMLSIIIRASVIITNVKMSVVMLSVIMLFAVAPARCPA